MLALLIIKHCFYYSLPFYPVASHVRQIAYKNSKFSMEEERLPCSVFSMEIFAHKT
jgi:hypothetical protein